MDKKLLRQAIIKQTIEDNREVLRRLAQVERDASSTIPWNEVKRT